MRLKQGMAKTRQAGFSLMEIIVAVAVIALLAGVLTPMIGNVIEDSRKARAASDCKSIAEAIGAYRQEVGLYPPGTQNDPTYNFGDPAVLSTWLNEGAKKYLGRAVTKDPWGTAYQYMINSKTDPNMDVVVMSYGPDRTSQTWQDFATWNKGKFNGDDIGTFFDIAK